MAGKVNVPAKPKKRFGSANRRSQQNLFHLLENCRTLSNLSQIHAQVVLHGYARKPFLLSKLLFLYAFHRRPNRALAAAAAGIDRSPSTAVWNQIIRSHSLTATPWKSIQSFKDMAKSSEPKPDGFTYSFLLAACARSPSPEELGEQVHARVIADGFISSVFVRTNLVNMYVSGDRLPGAEIARRVFDEMPERNAVAWNALLKGHARRGDACGAWAVFSEMPDENKTAASWTTALTAFSRARRWSEALALFRRMSARAELDRAAIATALSACAESGDLSLGIWIHRRCDDGRRRSVSLSNALVHMYVRCGEIGRARRVFDEMPERTAATWTTVVAGLARLGRGVEALGLFRRMLLDEQVTPDEATFVAALFACSHSGLVEDGLEIFELMTRGFGITPGVKHYGCVVDLLSRAGFLHEAQRVIEAMPLEPGPAVWGALLNGCLVHGNADLMATAAEQLSAQLALDRAAAGYLVLASNAYASARKWSDAAAVRLTMVETGIRKPPGQSWVRVDGVVHVFVAGDPSHRRTDSIRKIIIDINRHSRKGNNLFDVLINSFDFGLVNNFY